MASGSPRGHRQLQRTVNSVLPGPRGILFITWGTRAFCKKDGFFSPPFAKALWDPKEKGSSREEGAPSARPAGSPRELHKGKWGAPVHGAGAAGSGPFGLNYLNKPFKRTPLILDES